jgi:hypothetical protein
MTENEWLHTAVPEEMLDYVDTLVIATERQLRLFACACCRHLWHLLTELESRQTITRVEQYADGLATVSELAEAQAEAWHATNVNDGEVQPSNRSYHYAAQAVAWLAQCDEQVYDAGHVVEHCFSATEGDQDATDALEDYQRSVLHDIFANPFRPIKFVPHWRTTNVVELAFTIYEDRAFDRMPILADALMDAGCEDEQIISHCRNGGPHVRGCWLLDAILNKA